MKKYLLYLFKFTISALLALAILCGFCLIYYFPPIAISQPEKYTNHRFETTSYWTNMTEGIGYGSINNLGYSDRNDFNPDLTSIAFIGSSQVQAMQVPQDKTFVSVTNDLLHGDDTTANDFQCVNLGVAGHYMKITASNFEYFLESFDNLKYIVMEVSTIYYDDETMEGILEEEFHTDLEEHGFLYNIVQRIPYFRLLAKQWQDLTIAQNAEPEDTSPIDYASYEQHLDPVLAKLANAAKAKGVELILLYQHPFTVYADKTTATGNDPEVERIFTAGCEKYGIPLINMNETMMNHFEATYEPCYGFNNTTLNAGHLNETGHRLIAETLYSFITEKEAE